MVDVAQGIITNGLGGNATNMILGQFHLGPFDGVIVIEPPVVKPPGGGGGSPFAGLIPYTDYQPWNTDHEELEKFHKVSFKITYNGKTWKKYYYMREKYKDAIVSVTGVIKTMIKGIRIKVSNARSAFNKFRIKRKQ